MYIFNVNRWANYCSVVNLQLMKTLEVMLGKLISIPCTKKYSLFFYGSNMSKELDCDDLISSLVNSHMSSNTNKYIYFHAMFITINRTNTKNLTSLKFIQFYTFYKALTSWNYYMSTLSTSNVTTPREWFLVYDYDGLPCLQLKETMRVTIVIWTRHDRYSQWSDYMWE